MDKQNGLKKSIFESRLALFLFILLVFVPLAWLIYSLVIQPAPRKLSEPQAASIKGAVLKMYERTLVGLWNDEDEKVYQQLHKYIPEIEKLKNDGFAETSAQYENIISSITENKNAAEIAVCYELYGKLPDEIKILSRDEITSIWREKMQDPSLKVDFFALPTKVDYRYFIKISKSDYVLNLQIDAVTGNLLRYFENHDEKKTNTRAGEPKPQELLQLLLDKDGVYDYSEIEGNYYEITYQFNPVYYGYPVRIQTYKGLGYSQDVQPVLRFARNSITTHYFIELGRLPSSESELGSTEIKYSLEQAVELARQSNLLASSALKSYELIEIAWIWCRTTGKYEPAYFIDDEYYYYPVVIFANTGLPLKRVA